MRAPETRAWLNESVSYLDENIIDALLVEETRPRVTEFGDAALVILRGVNLNENAEPEDMISIRFWIDLPQKRQLHENYERMLRYVEDLDALRERAQVVKDELAAMLVGRMNRNMYILSIVAAIFMPLGFLTGLLGINVGGMPGAANDHAFWIVAALCAAFIVTVGGMYKHFTWL